MTGGGLYGLRLLREPRLRAFSIILLAAILVAFRATQFFFLTPEIQWGYDFGFYWRAGTALMAGEPIYSSQQLAGPYAPQGQNGFLYPPPFAALIAPWTTFGPADYRVAAWGWTALGAAILVLTVLAVARSEGLTDRLLRATGLGPWVFVAAALGFAPVVSELNLGNVHLLLVGLLGLAWLGIRDGSVRGERLAGAAIGIAAIVKIFPGVILLWFLLTRRWQGAAFVPVGALAATLLALPITGIQPWLDYPTVLANLSAPADATDSLAPTVWLAPWMGFLPARLLVTAVGLVVLVWAALRRTPRMAFTVAVLVSVLIAPGLYHHYLAITVLPFLLLLAEGRSMLWLGVAYVLMSGGRQDALGDYVWVVNRALPTVGVLLVLALAVRGTGGRNPLAQPETGPDVRLRAPEARSRPAPHG